MQLNLCQFRSLWLALCANTDTGPSSLPGEYTHTLQDSSNFCVGGNTETQTLFQVASSCEPGRLQIHMFTSRADGEKEELALWQFSLILHEWLREEKEKVERGRERLGAIRSPQL